MRPEPTTPAIPITSARTFFVVMTADSDRQASAIEQRSDLISNEGGDTPSQITQLTAESMKMSFLSESSHSSIESVSKSLETMARKS